VKLVWSRTALADRREIRSWIAQDNPAAAVTLDEHFAAPANSNRGIPSWPGSQAVTNDF